MEERKQKQDFLKRQSGLEGAALVPEYQERVTELNRLIEINESRLNQLERHHLQILRQADLRATQDQTSK